MSAIAVIRDPQSIREIIDCIESKGRGLPKATTTRNQYTTHSHPLIGRGKLCAYKLVVGDFLFEIQPCGYYNATQGQEYVAK
jgi:hypothetical protein